MKLLLCVLLMTISCQVILCDDVPLVETINTAVPEILQGGIYEGKLPGGPYYLHHIVKSSIGAQNSYLTLDVRRLDNQTTVVIKATIDNIDFSVKASCFTSKIGENIMALSQGWGFDWLRYGPYGRGTTACYFNLEWDFMIWNTYELTAENFAVDSEIKTGYQALLDSKNAQYKDIVESLNPDIPPGPIKLRPVGEYFFVSQYIGQSKDGEYDYEIYSLYQPCTGDRNIFYNYRDNWV